MALCYRSPSRSAARRCGRTTAISPRSPCHAAHNSAEERRTAMPSSVRDNPAQQRYELELEGGTAFATYERQGDTLLITHTNTPPALRGQGVAGRLVTGLLADVRAR